ncbi:MAG: response regulator [Bacteriovoracaceae bacterium]|nr:response regulator [Bacteriovoracaceae bacterium]
MIKILSVDDSEAVFAYVKCCFNDDQYFLTHAICGMDALDLLKKDLMGFDIILLDWEMPQMNGPEVLIEMKKLGVTTPIIMVTTRNKENDIKLILESGAAEYIMKPFTADIIQQKILQLIQIET